MEKKSCCARVLRKTRIKSERFNGEEELLF